MYVGKMRATQKRLRSFVCTECDDDIGEAVEQEEVM